MAKSKSSSKSEAEPEQDKVAPLGEFGNGLLAEGVPEKLVRKIMDRVHLERAEAIAEAAKLFRGADEPLTKDAIIVRVDQLARFAGGVYAAALGLTDGHQNDPMINGVVELIDRLEIELRQLAEEALAQATIDAQRRRGQ